MKKLTKFSTRQEIGIEIHCFLVKKEESFTLLSAYREIIEHCEEGIDTNLVESALFECMDRLLEDGSVRYIDGRYYSTPTVSFELA